jgi:hypothetical protein
MGILDTYLRRKPDPTQISSPSSLFVDTNLLVSSRREVLDVSVHPAGAMQVHLYQDT